MYLTNAAAAPRSGIAPVGDWAGAGAVVFPPPLAGEGTVGACVAVDSWRSMAATTSRRRIAPPGPVPLIRVRSIPRAFASSSAPSVVSTPMPGPPFGGGDCGAAFTSVLLAGSAAGGGGTAAAGAGSAAGAFARGCSAPPSAPSSISASAAPTVIVWPASARILTSLPLAGAGISASTLSVVTSTRASPSRTGSPGCFSHLATVPSVTDSPISGRVTCMVDWGTIEFYPASSD